MKTFDAQRCRLGEGPLWHPERGSLFWFDIMEKRLFERETTQTRHWQFDEHFSAAGWVDRQTLLMASETALWRFDIENGSAAHLCPLDEENPLTRSNDGRADPWGGFWIGTMGKSAQKAAGGIFRYFRGTLAKVASEITVSNAICFAPDKSCAYYTDTVTHMIMRQPLDATDGWPSGDASVFVDLSRSGEYPDGAVTDALGNIWVALWGAACVVCFDAHGKELRRIDVPARQPTCPAFGGPNLRDLYVTSATQGLSEGALAEHPLNGATFALNDVAQGQAEPRVLL